MNYGLLIRTLSHLRLKQIIFQLRLRLVKPTLVINKNMHGSIEGVIVQPIDKCHSYSDNRFSFLNIESEFLTWNDVSNGMLWAYNLNYMDWLCQADISFSEGKRWIDRFIKEIYLNKVGLDPYPIALRCMNWIKFILLHQSDITESTKSNWNSSLYSQYVLLSKKFEYHLLGNHLLEDAYSLFIGSIYLNEQTFYQKAKRVLLEELKEEILADGSHYEQSPMYHCILLDRLLDCYNISTNNIIFDTQKEINYFLKEKAIKMLGHLENILFKDGSFPMFNDAALNIAPSPQQIFDYAKRLGLQWEFIPLKECGYRKLVSTTFESFVDVGNIEASYQPGHSHADTFNYELRIDGKPFIIDTGISTYNKTERRQYERSTAAHNTVTVNGMNSSEVWGGFRIGKRAKVQLLEDNTNRVVAVHDGFGRKYMHKRIFSCSNDVYEIHDSVSNSANCISYIHFDKDVQVISYTNSLVETNKAIIHIDGASSVEMVDEQASNQYNIFESIKVVKIYFNKKLSYKVIKLI